MTFNLVAVAVWMVFWVPMENHMALFLALPYRVCQKCTVPNCNKTHPEEVHDSVVVYEVPLPVDVVVPEARLPDRTGNESMLIWVKFLLLLL